MAPTIAPLMQPLALAAETFANASAEARTKQATMDFIKQAPSLRCPANCGSALFVRQGFSADFGQSRDGCNRLGIDREADDGWLAGSLSFFEGGREILRPL